MTELQLLALLTVAIPILVKFTKKLNIPVALIPFVPLAYGVMGEIILVATGMSAVTYSVAVLLGLGAGGVSSSGYDIHKKIKKAWENR